MPSERVPPLTLEEELEELRSLESRSKMEMERAFQRIAGRREPDFLPLLNLLGEIGHRQILIARRLLHLEIRLRDGG